MKIEELKYNLTNAQPIKFPLIFKCLDNFIPLQYIKFISNTYVVEEAPIKSSSVGLFENILDHTHPVYQCEELDFIPSDNSIIICKKINSSIQSVIDFVEVPKIDPWMVEDLAVSLLKDVKKETVLKLVKVCESNPFRTINEIDKLLLFEPQLREIKLKEFLEEGICSDLSEYNIFNLTNALQSRNINEIHKILTDMLTATQSVDIEPFGLLTILYKNIKNMIRVWGVANPTEQNTKLTKKQIYAINKIERNFSPTQLNKFFLILCSLDIQIKQGEFPAELLVDYLIIKGLSV